MVKELAVFIFGIIIGMGVFILLMNNTPTHHSNAVTLITECQAELPRNQKCVLKAVPEESE